MTSLLLIITLDVSIIIPLLPIIPIITYHYVLKSENLADALAASHPQPAVLGGECIRCLGCAGPGEPATDPHSGTLDSDMALHSLAWPGRYAQAASASHLLIQTRMVAPAYH